MQKTLGIALMLLVPIALGAPLSASPPAADSQQAPPAEEHPEGGHAEHPEGEHAEHAAEEGAHHEHPAEQGEGAEHPEESEAAAEPLTLDELADAMEAWVASESEATGYMEVDDPVTGETLQLTLDHVHRERLAHTDEQTYFACADFEGADGTLYDIDIFMEGPDAESLEATEVSVHKVDGEPRYTWYEEDGVWKKQPVEG